MQVRGLTIAAVLFACGCDYTGDWLFAGEVPGVPGVWHLEDEEGRLVVPRVVQTFEELQAATIYAEVGPSSTTELGGVTIEFLGTGSDICVWVDPETAYWNQAVAVQPSVQGEPWTYPDNIFDDGDLDMFVGLSVYYTGSPGERLGDFVVSYEDSLENEIPIQLSECHNLGVFEGTDAFAGRATPEYCALQDTQPGVSYTIVLQTFSTPLDDDRLGFGLLVTEGNCDTLYNIANGPSGFHGAEDTSTLKENERGVRARVEECVIMGESMVPQGREYGPWYGHDAIKSWNEAEAFEAHFCSAKSMRSYCNDEFDQVVTEGPGCSWAQSPDEDDRCYCGDETDTPEGGAF